MNDKVFLDTNVLVYAYDQHDPDKQARAQGLISAGIEAESTVLSSQVLGEFFVVVTRKIQNPLSPDDARKIVNLFSICPVVEIDVSLVKRAVDLHIRYSISYWDALIVAAAARAKCSRILTEDLANGALYDDVLIDNPFKN